MCTRISLRPSARIAVALIGLLLIAAPAEADVSAKVYVILWFDTEDYILPASDDAALKVADWLHKQGIRATFKVVGEKARTLEKRGRADVIAALKQHEIGYHSNFHSVQPSPAMYLSNLGWDEGVAEFDRRERPGYDDVKRIFGQAPSCYGQPGSSWGPQSFGAMRKWGMPVYLDSGRHIGLDGKPHYFDGVLTLYHLTHTLRTGLGGSGELQVAEDRFIEARKKLLADGGGLVSIYYHPCEFVHKQFWDGVNFSKGANPPREQWQLPPTKTDAESKTAYDTFQAYITFIQRFPEVQFITATEAAGIYRDAAKSRQFSREEIKAIAAAVGDEVNFQKRDNYALAPSEVLAVLNRYLTNRESGEVTLGEAPFGPTGVAPLLAGPVTTSASQFQRTAVDVASFLARQGRVPGSVWLGSAAVTPEAYLVALAKIVAELIDGKPMPEKIEFKPAILATAKYVAEDAPNLWGWVIFPPGFRAPAMMELAKRQAWTIKPAIMQTRQ
ncbi:MAG: hypothetical protein ACJ8F7_14400 [Gemmataceae bacterium]